MHFSIRKSKRIVKLAEHQFEFFLRHRSEIVERLSMFGGQGRWVHGIEFFQNPLFWHALIGRHPYVLSDTKLFKSVGDRPKSIPQVVFSIVRHFAKFSIRKCVASSQSAVLQAEIGR